MLYVNKCPIFVDEVYCLLKQHPIDTRQLLELVINCDLLLH